MYNTYHRLVASLLLIRKMTLVKNFAKYLARDSDNYFIPFPLFSVIMATQISKKRKVFYFQYFSCICSQSKYI
jgi:hypothetical protein